jgi:hypothetical protein
VRRRAARGHKGREGADQKRFAVRARHAADQDQGLLPGCAEEMQ